MKCSDPSASRANKNIGSQNETYIEAEFYFDNNFAGDETLIACLNGNSKASASIGLSAQSGCVFAYVEVSLPSYSYTQCRLGGITIGTWYKFALDVSATSATLYINDMQVASTSQVNIPATASVSMGMFWGSGAYTGNLYVDNVQVSSTSPNSSTLSPISTPIPTPTPAPSPVPTPTVLPTPTPTQTSTPTPTPTPTLTPTPTPTPTITSLPLSCLGDDYLVFGNFNGYPSYWINQTHWFTQFHCNTAKLGISFADEPAKGCSTYDKTKLAGVLTILDTVGVKVILVDQNGDTESWFGSQAWINDWKQVAKDFKGDTRINSFDLMGECYSQFWDSSSAFGAWSLHDFDLANKACIDAIRSVDPSRTIMYPTAVGIFTSSASAFYNDLVSTGVIAEGNLLYDIVHPYYFQQYPNMDPVNNPVGDADWYWNNYCLPQISYFGVSNCCCGETFPWSRYGCVGGNPANGYYNYTLQQQFEVAMINHFVSAGMGFQMWCFFSAPDQQADIDALTNSNYGAIIRSG